MDVTLVSAASSLYAYTAPQSAAQDAAACWYLNH